MKPNLLCPDRVRKINGSFAFIEHRFLRDGFSGSLSQLEIILYLFLVIVSDRKGLSWYAYDKICTILRMTLDEYQLARNALIDKDLIAFDGYLFQVLSLPEEPVIKPYRLLKTRVDMDMYDPATIHDMVRCAFRGPHD